MSLSRTRAWYWTASRLGSLPQCATTKSSLPSNPLLRFRSSSTKAPLVRHRNAYRKGGWKRESLRFVQQAKSKSIPNGDVFGKAKELLIKLVNLPHHAEKGTAAARLLEVALEDLRSSCKDEEYSREMRGKLYQLTVEAWIGTTGQRKRAWKEAEGLLWEMLDNAKQNDDNQFYCQRIQRNVDTINNAFSTLVYGFCKAERQLSVQTKTRLEPILQTIQQLWDDPQVRLVPSPIAVDSLLYCWSRSRRTQEADELLWRALLETKEGGNPLMMPTIYGISSVLTAHAKEGNVTRTKEILDLMLDEESLPRPNVVSFNILLDAIVQKGGRDAGKRAEQILQWMESLCLYPDTRSFTSTISAWAKSCHPDTADRAEAILRHTIDLQASGRTNVAPNDVTFSAVIHAFSRSGRPDAAEKGLELLELVKTLYGGENFPKERLTPVFNSLIWTFAKSGREDAAAKALDCLQRMDTLGVPTSAGTHNAVMTAMQSDNQGAPMALEYFREIESKYSAGDAPNQLDVISFNMALNALSKSDRETAPAQAMELLQRMMGYANIDPDVATFNTVMKILAKSSLEDAGLRCEKLLEDMQKPPFAENTRPNVITFSSCITAWAYTRSHERYDRMNRLLQQMVSSHQARNRDARHNLNAIPFNAVLIGCCCSTEDKERALQCVLETVDLMRRTVGVTPNQSTYPLILRSIGLNTIRGERRDTLLLKEFEHCADDGLVCSEAIAQIEETSPGLLAVHWPQAAASYEDAIPNEWRRNVQPK